MFFLSFKRLFVMGLVNGVVNRPRDSRAAEVQPIEIALDLISGVLGARERVMSFENWIFLDLGPRK